MGLREVLGILRRRWLIVVACALTFAAIAVVAVLSITPRYASTARLFMSTPSSGAGYEAYQGGLFSQQRVYSYAGLVNGSTVAGRVITRLGLTESPVSLSARISAQAQPQTVILAITATDTTPDGAQAVAQTTAEVFAAYVTELEGGDGSATGPIRANIVDDANLPAAPYSPRPLSTIGIGLIVGLLVGLGLAWLRDILDNTIKTAEDLADVTEAAALGVIGADPRAGAHPLIVDTDRFGARAEAFRVLCTNIQFLDVDHARKTITLTSPQAGDGKSTTAANIAMTLAQAEIRTVLVDADLRRPTIADLLGLEPAVGLTTVLRGQLDLGAALQRFGSTDLDVLTSGPIPPNPAELLQSKAMAALLAELTQRYEIVILDAPPVLPVADATVLAGISDGVILVTRAGATTRDEAIDTIERLEAVDATLFGTVLNFASAPSGRSGRYGYGYEPAAPAERDELDDLLADGRSAAPARPDTVPSGARSGSSAPGVDPIVTDRG